MDTVSTETQQHLGQEGSAKKNFSGNAEDFINKITSNGTLNHSEVKNAVDAINSEINIADNVSLFSHMVGSKLAEEGHMSSAAECFEIAFLQRKLDDPNDPTVGKYAQDYVKAVGKHLQLSSAKTEEKKKHDAKWLFSKTPLLAQAVEYIEKFHNEDEVKEVKEIIKGFRQIRIDERRSEMADLDKHLKWLDDETKGRRLAGITSPKYEKERDREKESRTKLEEEIKELYKTPEQIAEEKKTRDWIILKEEINKILEDYKNNTNREIKFTDKYSPTPEAREKEEKAKQRFEEILNRDVELNQELDHKAIEQKPVENPVEVPEKITTTVNTAPATQSVSYSEPLPQKPNVSSTQEKAAEKTPPKFSLGNATWRSKDIDLPITVTGYLGNVNGVDYVSIEGYKSGVPLNEIEYDKVKVSVNLNSSPSRPTAPIIPDQKAVNINTPISLEPKPGEKPEALIEQVNKILSEANSSTLSFEALPDQLANYIKTLTLPFGVKIKELKVLANDNTLSLDGAVDSPAGTLPFSIDLANNNAGKLMIKNHAIKLTLRARLFKGKIDNTLANLDETINQEINKVLVKPWELENIHLANSKLVIAVKK